MTTKKNGNSGLKPMIHRQEDIDFLAEVVVSHLMTNKKIDESNVYVHLLGVFRRFFLREIEEIKPIRNASGDIEWNVFIHREGLYDLLPEGFFHTTTRKYFKDREETLREFRGHREEEKRARLLFSPLEQEFFRYRVYRTIFEQNFFYTPEAIQAFIDFFDLDKLGLNIYQKAALFFILPHIPRISGNISLTETCFRIILQEEVKIKIAATPPVHSFDDSYAVLGSVTLGRNSVPGSLCTGSTPALTIEIGPLADSSLLKDYLFGVRQKVLVRLSELFTQSDLDVSFIFLLNEDDRCFLLGERDFQSRLNYSTNI